MCYARKLIMMIIILLLLLLMIIVMITFMMIIITPGHAAVECEAERRASARRAIQQ